MTIRKASWHYKVYSFWHKGKYGNHPFDNFVNLCPYMRAILFWSWMRWIFIDAKIVSGLSWGTIVALPWIFGNLLSGNLLYGLMWAYRTILFICGLCVCAVLETWIKDNVWLRNLRGNVTTSVSQYLSFLALLRQWFKAIHNKVCPIVYVQE